MPAARSDLCEVSPITQRSASTRFDLPQPFGPTTPVRPCSIWKSVGSTKDLKPSSRNLLSFMDFPSRTKGRHTVRQPRRHHRQSGESGTFQIAPENESPKSRPQQGNAGGNGVVPCGILWRALQLFGSSGSMILSSSSIVAPPFCILPFTNSVGVNSTLYSLLPRSRIAMMLL